MPRSPGNPDDQALIGIAPTLTGMATNQRLGNVFHDACGAAGQPLDPNLRARIVVWTSEASEPATMAVFAAVGVVIVRRRGPARQPSADDTRPVPSDRGVPKRERLAPAHSCLLGLNRRRQPATIVSAYRGSRGVDVRTCEDLDR